MNVRRVAALLRELADEIERDESAPPAAATEPKRQRRRRVEPHPDPNVVIDDLARARARQILRKR